MVALAIQMNECIKSSNFNSKYNHVVFVRQKNHRSKLLISTRLKERSLDKHCYIGEYTLKYNLNIYTHQYDSLLKYSVYRALGILFYAKWSAVVRMHGVCHLL